jgi:hypothetical protein
MIINKELKSAILDLNDAQQIVQLSSLHFDIAQSLVKNTTTIRNLEERTYHLNRARTSKSFFHLKETLSNIENFLLFFNPINKYNLSYYWSVLVPTYEPVIEYNKSIEYFNLKYLPNT